MAFYFRKSIKIGGIRFNFSKLGVSYSVSPIKGFRITTGARGTYATVGSHGFYYRERIDKPRTPDRSTKQAPADDGNAIPTADVSQFVDATSVRMVTEINTRKNAMQTAPLLGGICGLGSLLLFASAFPAIAVIGLIATAVITAFAAHYDRIQRITSLHYDLGSDLSKFVERQRICQILARTQKVWRIIGKQSTSDWKRNAGARSLLNRKEVYVGKLSPPCIETNVEIFGIDARGTTLYFFPDYVFVLQDGRYGAIEYESLAADFATPRFIEDSYAPSDATIVGHTWQFVRKDGGPDQRFSNNRQLPIAVYGEVVLTSSSGLNIHLQCSHQEVGRLVAEQIQQLSNRPDVIRQRAEQQRAEEEQRVRRQRQEQEREERERWEQERAERQRADHERAKSQGWRKEQTQQRAEQTTRTAKSDYEILQVSRNATSEQITAAYIRLAQMYHPDKVESLAPEYKVIATTRMKEINDAYARLKTRYSGS